LARRVYDPAGYHIGQTGWLRREPARCDTHHNQGSRQQPLPHRCILNRLPW
jgi:hypothetical protein